ncbi:chalcone isomerase family protein [Hahella sp. NBU794]|uniref:chalcone isomerase family protein n=1 Tax=Hahella sp. NBU794 TaxID=3422590 RepID=UPI003D6E1C88
MSISPTLSSMLFIVLLSLTKPSFAVTLQGVEVPESLPPEGDRPSLSLNGAATRRFLVFVDVYVGALYVERTTHEAPALLADEGYRRMEFTMLRDVRGRKIADAFYEGMRLNISKQQAEDIRVEIEQMVHMFDQKLEKGDTAVVEYIPGVGAQVWLDGHDRGVIPGKKLFDAILSIWIGDYPVSQDFKAGILGAPQQSASRMADRN